MSANTDSTAPAPQQPTGVTWMALGRALQDAGRHAQAVSALQRAAILLPLDIEVYRALIVSLDATGQEADATSARIGADALGRRRATDLYEIGRVYAGHKQWSAAAHWLEKALLIDPHLNAAHSCMAWALRQLGRESAGHRLAYRTYRRQPAFAASRARARRRLTVLVLCTSERANVPTRHLFPRARYRILFQTMNEGAPEILRRKSDTPPPYEVSFNAIGDPDRAASSQNAMQRFMAARHEPMLNPPARIARTYRECIGKLLDGVAGMHLPATMRWDCQGSPAAAVHAALKVAGIGYPAIVRPAGEHGGEGVVLLGSPADPGNPTPLGERHLTAEMYLTAYYEYRSPDGCYRKYRVIYIDRVPYPYHLAIGDQWLLHYFSADMLSAPWKLEEERRFLDDPEQALGVQAWATLRAIGQRMDLDYCGIDFSLLPDGRVLVFEANATMLVHPEAEQDALRFKNVYIDRIFDAFDAMMARRAGRRFG